MAGESGHAFRIRNVSSLFLAGNNRTLPACSQCGQVEHCNNSSSNHVEIRVYQLLSVSFFCPSELHKLNNKNALIYRLPVAAKTGKDWQASGNIAA